MNNTLTDQKVSGVIDPTVVDPKLSNRFIVTFPDYFNIPEYVVNQVTRPSMIVSIEPKDETNFHFNPMYFRLLDPVKPSTSHSLMNALNILNQKDDKSVAVTLKSLSPIGEVIETWQISGKISNVDFGLLFYESPITPCYINLTMLVDTATLVEQ